MWMQPVKTIATALAGRAPGNTDELASANEPGAKKTMTQSLIRPADFQANGGAVLKEASAHIPGFRGAGEFYGFIQC